MIKLFLKYISLILFKLYGYEALNILLKNIPSKNINLILKLFGANIGENVRIKSP